MSFTSSVSKLSELGTVPELVMMDLAENQFIILYWFLPLTPHKSSLSYQDSQAVSNLLLNSKPLDPYV